MSVAGAAEPAVPNVVKAEPAPQWNAKFAGKEGWIGGDGVYSAVLGPRRILWLFGDTILGTVKDGGRSGAAMVNNTLGIHTGTGKDAAIRFISGKKGKDGKPTAFFTPADGTGFFWPQGVIRVEARLYIFLVQVEKTNDPGAFGFKLVGQWLAVIENPDDEPAAWRSKQHKLPFARFSGEQPYAFGAAALKEAGHVYIYGYAQREKGFGLRKLVVARAPADKLADFTAWRFRSEKGWSEDAADAALLAGGMATELSVHRLGDGKGFVAVYTENGLGDRIIARFSETPYGPWAAPVLLYKCPEMAKDKGVFSYAGKAHAWASTGDELLISYCVNTHDFGQLFRDETVYRPKFVRVKLAPPK
jgi:hypothetical protein